MKEKYYDVNFYELQEKGSLNSAKVMIPIIKQIIKPTSVVDVGCGVGTWLSVFKEENVHDVLGVDGEYVDKNKLYIPIDKFHSANLEEPLKINRKFDLVMSLEVAEHLHRNYAERFVESLTNLGDVVLFAAAIPYQGGVNHINEQWPEYWIELFNKRGYKVIDCIREKVWNNPNVEMWYAQNSFLFAKKEAIESNPLLKCEYKNKDRQIYSIVHPKMYEQSKKEYMILYDKIKILIKIKNFLRKMKG